MKRYLKPVGLILILQILAFMTSYFVTAPAVSGWYQSIAKSQLNPPDGIFAPVWAILYTILGIVLWKLWPLRATHCGKRALAFFLIQLALNYCWSYVFFGMGAFGMAFIILILMDGLTICCMLAASAVDKTVSRLLIPYLAWIGFATYLTYAVMALN